MPTNNILLFDQNKGNMMGDEEYSTNTQRLNGVQTGIASSQLQNKFQYQVSLVAYAIASLMYNNGLDANDANAVSAFVSNLSGTLVQKVLDKANTQEAQLGTVDTKWMSPALVKAAIDYCHANAITFGSNVTVGGNLLVSGTSSMNGAATFASTSTFTGAATFNGVAQGQSPTANSHFATKGYVDNALSSVLEEVYSGQNLNNGTIDVGVNLSNYRILFLAASAYSPTSSVEYLAISSSQSNINNVIIYLSSNRQAYLTASTTLIRCTNGMYGIFNYGSQINQAYVGNLNNTLFIERGNLQEISIIIYAIS